MVECFCSMSLFSLAASTTSWSNCKRQNNWLVKLTEPPGHTYSIQNSKHGHLRHVFPVLGLQLKTTHIYCYSRQNMNSPHSLFWLYLSIRQVKVFSFNCIWIVYVCVCALTVLYFPFQSWEHKQFQRINTFFIGHTDTRHACTSKQNGPWYAGFIMCEIGWGVTDTRVNRTTKTLLSSEESNKLKKDFREVQEVIWRCWKCASFPYSSEF